MGVAGAGKTTVGTALAAALGCRFLDGDTLHPPSNIAKMRAGVPLTDVDREPWLRAIGAAIDRALDRRESLVIACSALKERYRDALRADRRGVRFVQLNVSEETARARVAGRSDHFAGAALVPSQFAALEPPQHALVLNAADSPERLVAAIRDAFGV